MKVSTRTSSFVGCFSGKPGQAAESICPEVGVHFYASGGTSKVSPCESFGSSVQVVAFCPERHHTYHYLLFVVVMLTEWTRRETKLKERSSIAKREHSGMYTDLW